MQKIVPNIYTFTGLLAGRVYLLKDEDGLTLVDASISNAGNKILAQLKQAGHQPQDVKRIIITHGHPDHVGSLPMLKQVTGAQVICHEIEKPYVQGELPIESRKGGFHPPKTINKPTVVDQTVKEGDVLPVLGGLHIIETPGHSPGHVALWLPQHSVLIVGDALFHLFNRITLPPNFLTADQTVNKKSVFKIRDLRAENLFFGHGQPIVGTACAALDQFVQRLKLGK